MAKCKYIYKGHVFESELLLDDFLIRNGVDLYTKLGDAVFSTNTMVLATLLNLDNVRTKSESYLKAFQEAKRQYPDGEDSLEFNPPYVGVTTFLKGLTNSDDKLLTPEFREFEYWLKRIQDWKGVGFNEDEEALFGPFSPITDAVTNDDLQKYLENFDKHPETNNLVLNMIRQVKEKWQALGEIGTAIHAVLQKCFTTVKEGKNKGKLWMDLNADFITEQLKRDSLVAKYLTDGQIKEGISYAKNLLQEIRETVGGEDLMFFPEFLVVTELPTTINGADALMGIIDLLVIDSKGYAHIIDYKASPKYKFNSAKERGFWYLQGLYSRMMQSNDVVMAKENQVMIAPILMDGFRKNGDSFVIDHIKKRDSKHLLDITNLATLNEVARNLDEFVPKKTSVHIAPEDFSELMHNFMEKAFGETSSSEVTSDEKLKSYIERCGGIVEQDGKYSFTTSFGKEFKGDSEVDVFNKYKKYINLELPQNRLDKVQEIVNVLKKGIKDNTSDIEWPNAKKVNTDDGGTPEWFRMTLGKYCNSTYEIKEDPSLQAHGIIAIENKLNHQIDFIMITEANEDLEYLHKFENKSTLLSGNFVTEASELHDPNSQAMKAYTGNIKLMEMMAAINTMPAITLSEGVCIGNLLVANPSLAQGMAAGSNQELIYNFNKIVENIDGYESNISNDKDSKIKFATKLDLAINKFRDIMLSLNDKKGNPQYGRFYSYKLLLTDLDASVSENNQRTTLNKLNDLRLVLEKSFKDLIDVSDVVYNESLNIARSLYDKVMLAIAEVLGINFRQQVKDPSNWLDSMRIHENGVQSLLLDNPGLLNNETLNLLTKITTNAYQNIREDMAAFVAELRQEVKKLKEAMGFGKLSELTGGNLADLYKNMFKFTEDEDFVFVDPDDSSVNLHEAQREFLRFALKKFNTNRISDGRDIESLRRKKSRDYYRVPLCRGDFSSQAAQMGGLMNAIKYKLGRLNPKVWFEDMQRKLVGVFEDVYARPDNKKLFEMNNMFEAGEQGAGADNARKEVITRSKSEKNGFFFETNLETLLLKHTFAYSSLENINKVMPMAKAAMVHLQTQGHLGNRKLTNSLNYVSDYIKNKIKNESLIPELQRKANAVLNQVKSAASFLALGFSPVSYGYQILQGLWTDVRLVLLTKARGEGPFTFKNFIRAGKEVYKDLFTLGNVQTKCSLLNEYFGINDMDTNVLAEKLKSDNYGVFNISNLAYHCASRPDYYNRMIILVAKMMEDGSWDAYSVKDGKLVYDWTKDARFSDFATGNTSSPKYKELQALYYTMADLLEKEQARGLDGKPFKLNYNKPAPLPKAYTNLEIESVKSLSDDIYGYYSHEKKSMIHALTWGALWIQMRTYWSGKKNQYLGAPGIKLRGKYAQEKDKDGKLLYKTLENGRLVVVGEDYLGDKIPFIKWQGDWQEGILVSLARVIDPFHPIASYLSFWEEWENLDPKVREIWKANCTQLLFDVTMFALHGSLIVGNLRDWDDEILKNAKNKGTFEAGLVASAAHVAIKSVSNSFLDFNFFESIGNPLTSWSPFSFTYLGSRISDLWETALGDKSFKSTLCGFSSATNAMSPLFKTVML